MERKIKVAIAGLGNRGKDAYAPTAKVYKDQMEIVAIADIVPEKVKAVAEEYNVPEAMCFKSAEEMLKQEKLADVMFICTQDRQHVGHAIPALRRGYDLLLEKPISPDLEECREILRVAEEEGRKVVVCHVLRYTPFYTKLKEVIDSGTIGTVMAVQASEQVGYYHQAHSFVRGNWCNSDETSPMILQKCCHDMDILLWLTGKSCRAVSSFGKLSYFKPECAPEGSALRCMDGCKAKENCPYDAEKIYITNDKMGIEGGNTNWPVNVLTLNPTKESVRKALEEGPYGRCVFHCGNNVVDHQVVNLDLEDGGTISFIMSGFTSQNTREIRIMGTQGEIVANMHLNSIDVCQFGRSVEHIDIRDFATCLSGHGGGDVRIIKDFLDWIKEGGEPEGRITSLERSVESHYVALAAEQSRQHGGRCVLIDEMRR